MYRFYSPDTVYKINLRICQEGASFNEIQEKMTQIKICRGSSPSNGHLRFFVDKFKKCILFLLYFALIIN